MVFKLPFFSWSKQTMFVPNLWVLIWQGQFWMQVLKVLQCSHRKLRGITYSPLLYIWFPEIINASMPVSSRLKAKNSEKLQTEYNRLVEGILSLDYDSSNLIAGLRRVQEQREAEEFLANPGLLPSKYILTTVTKVFFCSSSWWHFEWSGSRKH